MGLLKKFFGGQAAVQLLPTGTITVDRRGNIITSTVSSGFSQKLLKAIANDVLELLNEARAAQMPMAEVNLHFGSLRITGRELRGGAIIFLLPQAALFPTPNASTS